MNSAKIRDNDPTSIMLAVVNSSSFQASLLKDKSKPANGFQLFCAQMDELHRDMSDRFEELFSLKYLTK